MAAAEQTSTKTVAAGTLNVQASAGYVKETGTKKGLGVFASRKILQGETVEVCPVLVLRNPTYQLPASIADRVFCWGHLTGGVQVDCLALGWGSIYNHANSANMRFAADEKSEFLTFVAVRDIEAHEELTINYNGDRGEPTSTSGDWFSDRDIDPI
ncbi:SET domain-containing protein [Hydrogenophaga sp. UC242_50]|uniref:SET domain-containing protein n=1 Tax=unclassified Hydrogenophaga TaxID=2610897 RepID=UPI0036D24EE7